MKSYLLSALAVICLSCGDSSSQTSSQTDSTLTAASSTEVPKKPGIDTAKYDMLQTHLANGDTTTSSELMAHPLQEPVCSTDITIGGVP